MTKQEIIYGIDIAVDALKTNRTSLTSDVLHHISDIVEHLKKPDFQTTVSVVFNIPVEQVQNMVAGAEKFLTIEKRLFENDLDLSLVKTLSDLRGRNMILSLIAAIA